jgi:hypothetical protein
VSKTILAFRWCLILLQMYFSLLWFLPQSQLVGYIRICLGSGQERSCKFPFVPGPHFSIMLNSLRSGLSDPKEGWASDWYWVQYLVSLLRKHDVCKLCSFLNRNLPCQRLSLLKKHDVCERAHFSTETYSVIYCEFVKKAWCLQACSCLKRNLPCHRLWVC